MFKRHGGRVAATDSCRVYAASSTAAPRELALPGAASVRDYRAGAICDKQVIIAAVEAAGGNKSRAAQNLGMTLRQLDYRLKKSGLVLMMKVAE